MTDAQALRQLRHANAVAQRAMAEGANPFGAILVDGDGQTVLLGPTSGAAFWPAR
jgi:tRNA(Arg) A34 adenosine deaminase TadA